jgi:starch synthase
MQFQNPLLRGILHADHVNTVSKKHATEVQTKEFGEGLQKVLKKISSKLTGIANGIDTTEMDPGTDKKIKFHYGASRLKNRKLNKAVLQRIFNLPVRDDLPLVAYIGRYAAQKGIELILRSLEHIEELPPAQYIFLGGGDAVYCNELNTLAKKYPHQVAVKLHLDFVLARKLFAGSDIVLIPSKFEPGGIVAMEALRYGAIPVASDTGGLSETVIPYIPKTNVGNGFLHDRKSLWSFYGQLVTAIGLYQIPSVWKKIIQNGMRSDFSWDNTARKYRSLYQTLLKR